MSEPLKDLQETVVSALREALRGVRVESDVRLRCTHVQEHCSIGWSLGGPYGLDIRRWARDWSLLGDPDQPDEDAYEYYDWPYFSSWGLGELA